MANEWISVKDSLPMPFVSVLVFMPGEVPMPTVHEGFISSDGIWVSNHFLREPDEVTHWMPMPLPPDEYIINSLKRWDSIERKQRSKQNKR